MIIYMINLYISMVAIPEGAAEKTDFCSQKPREKLIDEVREDIRDICLRGCPAPMYPSETVLTMTPPRDKLALHSRIRMHS